MIARNIKPILNELLGRNPAVVLTGPRQVGKTTLAQAIARSIDASFRRIQCTADILPSDLIGMAMPEVLPR